MTHFNKMLDKQTYHLLQGSTLLDQKLFNKKKKFFYDTSYDILIKGDCGSSSSYLEIFKAIRQKAIIKPTDIEEQTKIVHTKTKIVHTKTNSNQNRNKNFNSSYTTNINLSQDLNSSNKFHSFFKSKSQTNMNKSLLSYRIRKKASTNTRNNFSGSFLKSNSVAYMGNSMDSHKSFIKCLDDKISKLDDEIEKMKKEEIFKVPSKFSNDQRSKVLSLLRDYFPKKPFLIMKERYNKLFGNEPYLKQIKKLKSRVSFDSKKANKIAIDNINDNNNDTNENKKKPSYLKVVNGGAIYNRKVVFNKYDTIGKVKILNIPKDFYNDITGSIDKYSLGASNVREMYSMVDQKEQKIINFANHYYYSREKKCNFNEKLNEINNEFSQVEINGKKIKNDILRLKSLLNDKSPLISDKIFAYIDDSPTAKNKKNTKRE